MPAVYLDADACPVKDEAIKVIIRHTLKLFIESNGGIRPSANPLIKNVLVSDDPDAADIWILDHVRKNDIVVTSDIPLAKGCLEIEAKVLKPNGDVFDLNNIDNLLATRNLMADLRSGDPMFQNKIKPFSRKDRSKFLNSLELELQRVL